MKPSAKLSGRFDWASCENSDLAELLASRAIAADNGSLGLSFQLACVNKELSVAVKKEVKRELSNLQSLYENYRKLVLTEEKYRRDATAAVPVDDPQAASMKKAADKSLDDFEDKFKQLMTTEHCKYPDNLLWHINTLQKSQKAHSELPDSDKLVMAKFGFTFEDYTLVAHMCRSVCMLSSSMSTLDNWVAKRGTTAMHWPFAQQERLGCVVPTFYFRHTMYSSPPGKVLPNRIQSLLPYEKGVSNVLAGKKMSLDAVTIQVAGDMDSKQREEFARNALEKNDLGVYRESCLWSVFPELPFFPSAFVPRENSLAGRLRLTDEQIQEARDQVTRHEAALSEERKIVRSIRMRRLNDDASTWLRMKGHSLTIQETLLLLDAEGGTDAQQQWDQCAHPFVDSNRIYTAIDNGPTFQVLKWMDRQLKLRKMIREFTGKELFGSRVVNFEVDLSRLSRPSWWAASETPTRAISDMDVAVEHVVHMIMTGETKVELKGASYKNFYWSVDIGNGLKLEQPLPGVDKAGRIKCERFDAQRIRALFLQYGDRYGVNVTPLSLTRINHAKEILCGEKTKSKKQKDWGAELIQSIDRLDRATRKKMGFSNVIFQVFRINTFPDIENALLDLHHKMKTMCATGSLDKCPSSLRDFILVIVGNPLGLPVKYDLSPQQKAKQQAEREAKRKAIFAQIPEIESSDEDEDMEAEAGPSACYVPTSPQYSPTSPQYDPGGGVSYSPTSPDYADAADAPEYHPV